MEEEESLERLARSLIPGSRCPEEDETEEEEEEEETALMKFCIASALLESRIMSLPRATNSARNMAASTVPVCPWK